VNDHPCRITVRTGSASEVPPPPTSTDPCRLDREADALLHLGFRKQAERLAHAAAALREARP
jgi:hypothetical protein